MRLLCFGGTFNPIHHGHVVCARAVAEAADYDKVVLIPARQPPHKSGVSDTAPAQDRLEMCRLAVAGDPLFEVNEVELGQTGPSYTINTAREFQNRGWPAVHWLVGADMALSLPQWHEAPALLAQVHFVLMARPGWSLDWDAMPPAYQSLRDRVVTAPLLQISSTEVRRRVAAGRSIRYLVPPEVEGYIADKKLYSGSMETII